MIGVLKYGSGNVNAFLNIFNAHDVPAKAVSVCKELNECKKLVLPGVGAFDRCLDQLRSSNLLEEVLQLVLVDKVPILGVCIGMHMLARGSEEGSSRGLSLIPGQVKRFDFASDFTLGIPHMGWNTSKFKNENLFSTSSPLISKEFYFLHSYYFVADNNEHVLATCDYGTEFHAVVQKDNILGCQFHPEKSHQAGSEFLLKFAGI